MQQITLNVEEKYAGVFLAFLKTIHYVKIEDTQLSLEQDAELTLAIRESYNPENRVTDKEVIKELKRD